MKLRLHSSLERIVAQTSKSAVPRVSKPAGAWLPHRRFGNRRYSRFGNLRYFFIASALLASPAAFAETPDDYFHGGAVNYLSNNILKALEVVTNGRALFPDDIKLKKLEELLKQQDQQQQQKNQQDQQKQQEQQQSQKDQQQKPENQQSQAQKEQQDKKENQSASQKPEENSAGETNRTENAAAYAGQMTPQQARQLLDAQKAEEAMIPLKPEGKPSPGNRPFKDW